MLKEITNMINHASGWPRHLKINKGRSHDSILETYYPYSLFDIDDPQKKNIISADSVGVLKQLIVNVALPCILFHSISKQHEEQDIYYVVSVFAICMSMYRGLLLQKRCPDVRSLFTPWFSRIRIRNDRHRLLPRFSDPKPPQSAYRLVMSFFACL
jgi:hypothetical protein